MAQYYKYGTPGQSALHGKRIRTATLFATTTTEVLRLEVDDYQSIMKVSESVA